MQNYITYDDFFTTYTYLLSETTITRIVNLVSIKINSESFKQTKIYVNRQTTSQCEKCDNS